MTIYPRTNGHSPAPLPAGPNQDELIAGLREIGLSRYEACVYMGIVTDQTAKVTEISRRTGVPQPKVYQALDSLVEKGFCTLGSDSVNRYHPVSPHLAVEGHITRLQREQEHAHKLCSQLEKILIQGKGQSLWAPPIEIVKGVRQTCQMLVNQIQNAQKEILFFGKGPLVPAPQVPQAIREAGEVGIKLRLLFEDDFLDPVQAPEEVGLYRTLPGDKRTRRSLPTKLVAIDGQVAMASISRSGGASFLMLVVRHGGLLEHFLASFEHHWSGAPALG